MNRFQKLCAIVLVLALFAGMMSACSGKQEVQESKSLPNQDQTVQTVTEQPVQQPTDPPTTPDPEQPTIPMSQERVDSDEVNSAYLQVYFDIELEEVISEEEFVQSLQKVQGFYGAEVVPFEPLSIISGTQAVQYAVVAASLEELALVYTKEKIEACLAGLSEVDEELSQYLAVVVDLGLLSNNQVKTLLQEEQLTPASGNALLMAVAGLNGTARNFMGHTDDPDIYGKLMRFWSELEFFDQAELTELGIAVVMDKISTGYGLTKDCYDARFLPELTLRYGQDDIIHALQIIGLLQSEGIVAKLQMEPKVSVYEYMLEWGDPGDPTPTYEVRKMGDDFYLVFTMEYDLALEFQNEQDRNKLDPIVLEYAKKNSGEEGKNLLYASWWQPVYESKIEMPGDYFEIFDHVLYFEGYTLHFRTNLDLLAELVQMSGDLEVDQQSVWIDAPFYRYFLGEPE